MRGFAMGMLARRFQAAGFRTKVFEYASLAHGADRSAERLGESLRQLSDGGGAVHLVGHSLGGLVALLATVDQSLPGRTICLGSPLLGSEAARRVAKFASWTMGESGDRLIAGLDHWRGPREVGVIAGRLPYGLAQVLGGFGDDNDGTVRVAETQLPGIQDHLVLPASHSGLVFSQDVANASVGFLRTGRFAFGSR
ncbi:alpha/beta hydrolase [Ahniella affigens]|uniref:Alpha/beta hydrolase n=2 Tax=Ahniella affigens TaxID=2021234 RepID=A0A2P1PZD9_9GAMM|nr:alpha/beta hydrolase [Ahniella affigens]